MKLHLVQSLRLAIRSILRNPLLIVLAIVAVVCIQSVLLGTLFGKSLFGYSMTALEKRVDIRLSLVQDINESDKQKILSYIESAPNVENAKLISRSDIYTGFQTRHSNDFLTNQALKELDVNPFGDEIVVHLDKPTTHSAFIESLNDSDTIQSGITALIEDIDTIHNDTLVQKLTSFQRVGSTIGLAALLVSTTIVVLVLIVLSHMFLNQYAPDVRVMKTFGVSDSHIGAWLCATYSVCVVLATGIVAVIGGIIAHMFDSYFSSFSAGMSLALWYQSNLIWIVGFLLFSTLAIVHIITALFLLKHK